jgi:hypothetical protein
LSSLAASLDSLYVDVEGQSVPLRQLGQAGMPNPNTLVLNLASYPQVIAAYNGDLFHGYVSCECVCRQLGVKLSAVHTTQQIQYGGFKSGRYICNVFCFGTTGY